MGKRMKRFPPLAAALFIAVGVTCIEKKWSCGVGNLPVLALSGLYGCSDGKTANEKAVELPLRETSDKNAVLGAGKALKAASKEKKEILVTFIELGSVNCIPCRMMQPVMRAIEDEYGDRVKVVFHDVWTPEGVPQSRRYGIRVIPTQVFLDKNGREYYRHEGFFPKDEVVSVLRRGGVR